MTAPSIKETKEAAIEIAADALFQTGTLTDHIRKALTLMQLPGLGLFMTALPWKIDFAQGRSIQGLSENLGAASRDIHAQLVTLSQNYLPDTVLSINVDEARLPRQRPAFPARTIGGS